MIVSSFIKKQELLKFLPYIVNSIYRIDTNLVKEQILPIFKKLADNIIFFYEYPYVEKYYRDTYYNFYSKKHFEYNRDSIRLVIFEDLLDIDNFFTLEREEIEKYFYGFITIRPTTYKIIGYSFISPLALNDKNFVCCLSKKEALINGRKLSVHGFPFSSQDNEALTCSEISIMNIMDYFGNKYPEYSIILPSQILKILSKHSYQRQIPSFGLPTENISFVLKKLGFGTVVYSTDEKKEEIYDYQDFREILYIYIESGIPIIATLSSKNNHHAVLVFGRENIDSDIKFNKRAKDTIIFSDFFEKILIMNDNRFPYELVYFNKPIYDTHQKNYYKFKSIIIPLYPKVNLDAYQFKHFFFKIVESLSKNPVTKNVSIIDEKKTHIVRFYLTSSRSYKDYISKSKKLDLDFKTLIIEISMPKFIWVGEILEGDILHKRQKVKSVVVVDATESGLSGHLIFATDLKYIIIKSFSKNCFESSESKNIYQIIEFNKQVLYIYDNNLKGGHTKWKS